VNKILIFSGLMFGCSGGGNSEFTTLDAAVAETVATVIKVTWALESEGAVWLEYGIDGACEGESTNSTTGSSGESLVLGVPPVTDVCFTALAEIDGEQIQSESQTIRTGNLPSTFSTMTIEDYDPTRVAPGYIVGSNAIDPAMLYVINREGDVVWYQEPVNEFLRPQMIISQAGDSFIYNEFSKDFTDDSSKITRVSFGGDIIEEFDTPDGHHSFQELPDGTIVYIAIDVRETDEWGPVVGDSVVEIPPDGGDPVVVYTVWDDPNIELGPHSEWDSTFYPQGRDWTHANYIYYSEDRDTYTISFRNINTVLEFDRYTGETIRSVGRFGTHGTQNGLVQYPHAGYWTDDGTLMFLTSPPGTNESWGVEVSFDDDNMVADLIWSYGENEGHKSLILGEALRLSNDNTLVNFGSTGRLIEVTPEGDEVWSLYTSIGTFPGHTTVLEDFYGADQ
jgi:hypothetical protein